MQSTLSYKYYFIAMDFDPFPLHNRIRYELGVTKRIFFVLEYES